MPRGARGSSTTLLEAGPYALEDRGNDVFELEVADLQQKFGGEVLGRQRTGTRRPGGRDQDAAMHRAEELVMDQFVIEPFEVVGPLHFGDNRAAVERVLGRPERLVNSYLWYPTAGLKVELRGGACVYVESVLQRSIFTFRGIHLNGDFEELVDRLRSLHLQPTFGTGANSGAVDFLEVGLSLWREDDDLPHVDSVGAWSRGYWEVAT